MASWVAGEASARGEDKCSSRRMRSVLGQARSCSELLAQILATLSPVVLEKKLGPSSARVPDLFFF